VERGIERDAGGVGDVLQCQLERVELADGEALDSKLVDGLALIKDEARRLQCAAGVLGSSATIRTFQN
jgi:hypothetical protein